MNSVLSVVLRILGIGALVAGGLAVALAALAGAILLGPLVFWIAWNVLDFGPALGLPELGFWGIVLATLFLVVGWLSKGVDHRRRLPRRQRPVRRAERLSEKAKGGQVPATAFAEIAPRWSPSARTSSCQPSRSGGFCSRS